MAGTWISSLTGTAQGELLVTDSLIRNCHVVFSHAGTDRRPLWQRWLELSHGLNLFTGARLAETSSTPNNDRIFDDMRSTDSGEDRMQQRARGERARHYAEAPTALGREVRPPRLPGHPGGGTETRCRDPGPRGFGGVSVMASRHSDAEPAELNNKCAGKKFGINL